jgi:ABC-type uncharacterized transport system ATPase subunit
MSWKDAKSEASAWLERLNLPPDLHGQELDLDVLSKDLTQKGQFREMIMRAAIRQLKARGAKIKS